MHVCVTVYLLLQLQEAGQVGGVQVVFVAAVGEHEQVQVPPCGHHLVEGAELLKVQCALVVISVCLLEEPTRTAHLIALSTEHKKDTISKEQHQNYFRDSCTMLKVAVSFNRPKRKQKSRLELQVNIGQYGNCI